MGLSNDLISQFVKATKDTPKQSKETTAYGTVKFGSDGKEYVQLDGSGALTPVSSTVTVKEGDRVIVMIKNHTATITGNLGDRAVRVGLITDQENAIKNLQVDNATIHGLLTANTAIINELTAKNVTITGELEAAVGRIDTLETTTLTTEVAKATYATIENLYATNEKVFALEGTFGDFYDLSTSKFEAIEGTIESLNTTYANIDFSNISEATIGNFYAKSGLIKDVTVQNGTLTGELIGVTISGDLIKANTLVADALVLQGTDGLYYRLNASVDGVTEAQLATEEYQTKLHGDNIIAKTIAADKISVSDLVAFGATIGGFNISESSLYSGVKSSVHNDTRGIYLGVDSQVAIGDASRHIIYYQETDGEWKLHITADQITFGVDDNNLEEYLDDIWWRFDNQRIGGTNILRNSGTMSGFSSSSNWSAGTWRTAGGGTTGGRTIINITDAPNPHIKSGVEIVGDNSDRSIAQDNVPVATGAQYTISCYARGTGTLRLQVGKGDYISVTHKLDNVSEWTKYTFTFDGNDTVATNGVTNVYFCNRGMGTMELCGFKLELGDVATDWSPSPYTDYLNFSSNGLVIGDMSSGTLRSNVLIDLDSVDIRNGITTYASFGADYLYLGKNSRNAKIDLCNGLATLYHASKYSYDTVFVIDTGNTTEIQGLINPLCLTSVDDLDKVSIQFANANGVMGGIGIVGSWLRRFGTNMVDSYTILDSGNVYDVIDSGWYYTGGYGENFSQYNNETHSKVRYRKFGKTVEVRGVMKPTKIIEGSTTQYKLFTLPEGYRPDCLIYQRCQGSNSNTWLLILKPDGEVTFSRYGNGSEYVEVDTGTWLPFQITFLTD